MLPIYSLRCLTLNLNNWYISTEEEAYGIVLHNLRFTQLKLYRHMFDALYMPYPYREPSGSTPVTRLATASTPAPYPVTVTKYTKEGDAHWMPPADLILTNGGWPTDMHLAMAGCEEHPTTLENGRLIYLAWSLCGSCIFDYHKHRD